MDFKEWLSKGFLEVCAISSVAQRKLFLISILRRDNLNCIKIGLFFLPPLCLGDKVNADVEG